MTKLINAKKKLELDLIIRELKAGKLVVVPTETSYGLAALASNKKAVGLISKAKNQPEQKPVSIIVPDLKIAKKFGIIDKGAEKLVNKFMPGPLTLIVLAKKKFEYLGGKTIAFRVSSNKIVQKICEKLNDGITATSANLHTEPDTYSGKKAFEVFNGKVSLVVDAGVLPKRRPSNIFDVQNKVVVRKGLITEKQIKKVLND